MSLKHIALTGPPGIGKTTLVHKVSEELAKVGIPVAGFFTEEVRESGRRIGFDVVSLDGLQRGILSRIDPTLISPGQHKAMVGQYVVDIKSFENLAIPLLNKAESKSCILILDEIGKMELFSTPFQNAVRKAFANQRSTILATIPIPKGRPLTLVEEIRQRKDIQIITVSRENRDNLAKTIVDSLEKMFKK